MKTFFKYFGLFFFLIAAIIIANMAYDYIRVCWWGNAIEQVIKEVK